MTGFFRLPSGSSFRATLSRNAQLGSSCVTVGDSARSGYHGPGGVWVFPGRSADTVGGFPAGVYGGGGAGLKPLSFVRREQYE